MITPFLVECGQVKSAPRVATTTGGRAPEELALMRPQSITPMVSCETCGAVFPERPPSQRRHVHVYCSRVCSALARTIPLTDRFNALVIRHPGDACWGWRGCPNEDGYGMMRVNGHTVGAHRVSYMLTCGPIPLGKYVCHHCDTPPCTNPPHLWLGTQADNMRDCAAKGRSLLQVHPERAARGEQHGSARLTVAPVLAIRAAFTAGEADRTTLARLYGVGRQTVGDIVSGHTWSHL